MQQQCAFHTEQGPRQTLKILQSEGYEIVFKSSMVELSPKELTSEERKAWEEYNKDELRKTLNELERLNVTCIKNTNKCAELRNEIDRLRLEKDGESHDLLLQTIRRGISRIRHGERYSSRGRLRSLYDGFDEDEYLNVTCSCIIVKKGDNWVRYLQFLRNGDPIVTITGPNAKSIQSTLQAKF